MNGKVFYPCGGTTALTFAAQELIRRGAELASEPRKDVTHLLLPVPSFEKDGRIRGGGELVHILTQLPKSMTVVGGNLEHPALSGCKTIDLLQDPQYLAQNAAITADCAIRIAGNNLPVVLDGCPILVIGWGRIGKCLAAKLKAVGADVTVAARKESDRAMIAALSYRAAEISTLQHCLMRYRVIFNTVPAEVLSDEQVKHCRPDCIKIDLASKPGIAGNDVIQARGLPGKDAPESSGCLIARTVIRLIRKEDIL